MGPVSSPGSANWFLKSIICLWARQSPFSSHVKSALNKDQCFFFFFILVRLATTLLRVGAREGGDEADGECAGAVYEEAA